jgi:hypothetical protein
MIFSRFRTIFSKHWSHGANQPQASEHFALFRSAGPHFTSLQTPKRFARKDREPFPRAPCKGRRASMTFAWPRATPHRPVCRSRGPFNRRARSALAPPDVSREASSVRFWPRQTRRQRVPPELHARTPTSPSLFPHGPAPRAGTARDACL